METLWQWGDISCHFLLPGGSIVPDMFCNFYFAKNYKIVNNSATTEAREEISTYLKTLEFLWFFDVCLTKFENYQILLIKISLRFLVTTKPFSEWKSLIGQHVLDTNAGKNCLKLPQRSNLHWCWKNEQCLIID